MIDSTHALSISRQAQLAGISRGSVYYVPKPVGAADLVRMRRLDALHLARKISQYFGSDLYENLQVNREKIMDYANKRYSWQTVGEITHDVYRKQLNV